jgi:hypothetical protein
MMEDREVDAEQLMEEIGRALDDPTSLIEDFGALERPPVFNLDFIHPPHARSLRSLSLRSASTWAGWLS